ncbi:Imm7 family immunity protein [Kitasatospora sp. NPDC092948]|uniref:Imm7 family immunity protein n=1 Tax=Kitasatospora sp. NPDC092948 TaxID=3364088 RepID=UPI0038060ABB
MFEYHGWVTVRERADAEDEGADFAVQQARLRRLVQGIEERAREVGGPSGLVDVRFVNGEAFLHLGGFRNHRDPQVPALFREVGVRAPGSYGLLYVHDDEDRAHADGFVVHRMVRGQVSVHADAHLSPCVPVLEDPWTG